MWLEFQQSNKWIFELVIFELVKSNKWIFELVKCDTYIQKTSKV